MRYKFYNYFGFNDSGPRLTNFADADVGFMINYRTSGKKDKCKGVVEWIVVKFNPFVCLALKQIPQKSRLKKSSTLLTLLFVIMSLIFC